MAETSYIIQNGRRLNLKDPVARKSIGSCDELETETKHCLVMAINELNRKVVDITARLEVLEGGGNSGLPSGYVLLEYVESSGTQYIDTDFMPNQDTRTVVDCCFIKEYTANATGAKAVYGCRTTSSSKAYVATAYVPTNEYRWYYNDGFDSTAPNQDYYVRKNVVANKNICSFGALSKTRTYAEFQCEYTMYLFGSNNAGTASFLSGMKLYSCQIYDNGTLVRDYLPCINPSGEYGLFDMVENKFYGNAGSGAFTGG